MINHLPRKLSVLFIFAVAFSGCAKATVKPTQRADGPLPRPDMIIVHNFAVTADEVKLDRGAMATAIRDAGKKTVTEEENQLGHLVAEKLAQALVEELRSEGISAVRAGPIVQSTNTTLILNGQFLTIDQGNQTTRVWIGFGLGGSELRTHIQAIQGGEIVAQAETATKSSLKPGMLASLGAGAAAESGAAVAVGAAGTGISETLLATVEADAKRTAKAVAKEVRQAYVKRGWLPG